jgi:hypothetical protein
MGKKKPDVKKYSTNVDTISLNIEQFTNEDPRFPYHSEPPPSDIRRLYKKGHQFCSPSEPKKARKKKRELRRHGENINVDALSLNLKDHSGPFLGKPDEVLPPSEIYKLEEAYRTNPSSLPPEIRHKMDEGRQKNLESLSGRNSVKPKPNLHIYNSEEFDKVLCKKYFPKTGTTVYAIKGNNLINLLLDGKTKKVILREEMRLSKSKIQQYSKIHDCIELTEIMHSIEPFYDGLDSIMNPHYKSRIRIVIDERASYHPNGGKRNY